MGRHDGWWCVHWDPGSLLLMQGEAGCARLPASLLDAACVVPARSRRDSGVQIPFTSTQRHGFERHT